MPLDTRGEAAARCIFLSTCSRLFGATGECLRGRVLLARWGGRSGKVSFAGILNAVPEGGVQSRIPSNGSEDKGGNAKEFVAVLQKKDCIFLGGVCDFRIQIMGIKSEQERGSRLRSRRSATDAELRFAARAWNAGRIYRSCSEGYADQLSDALAGKQNQRQIKRNKHSE